MNEVGNGASQPEGGEPTAGVDPPGTNAQQVLAYASSFPDVGRAESLLGRAITHHRRRVVAWLEAGQSSRMEVVHRSWRNAGLVVFPDGSSTRTNTVRAVLTSDVEMPHGFRVLNGYPAPAVAHHRDFPAASRFFGAYLHADWCEEAADEWSALAAFATNEVQAKDFANQARSMIYAASDPTLADLLLDLGSCLIPRSPRPESLRLWIHALANQAERLVGSSSR
ncbi:RNase A-like domain-containing protein [Nocardioides sp. Leaf307]|uniref:RNase A-like domain-containing protein n=1 Tax=Nocardioides sp. Leaf307 TaxID=1736331 RepID=UPI0012E99DA1|nr:RNase A-like domain-containing protein [Nocardioides sp. Leaf307]